MVVSPLRPFEAMAMEKAVVLTDLPALREIVSDGETGLIVNLPIQLIWQRPSPGWRATLHCGKGWEKTHASGWLASGLGKEMHRD